MSRQPPEPTALTRLPAPVASDVGGLAAPDTAPAAQPFRRRRRWGRVGAYLLTVLLLLTLNFFLPRALPGDPIEALVDPNAATRVPVEELRADLEDYYGLDRPVLEQYARYLAGLARGDLGTSIRYNAPVWDLVLERLPWTLLLVLTALALALVVGWAAGIHSGWRRGDRSDRSLLVAFLTLHSFPIFFVGSLAAYVLAVKLGWFPLSGVRTPFLQGVGRLDRVLDVAYHLVLPASVLALSFITSQYLTMRAAMVSQLGADYLLAGRAKGLRERRLKYAYAARNALLPAVTLTALQLGFAFTGSILVETVFAYQGLGRLVFESVGFRDYPTLQGCFLLLSLAVVTGNFLADLLYGRLDPRTAEE